MEFRKMITTNLYAGQQKRHRCIEQSFGVKHLIQADTHSVVCWFPNFIMEDNLENLLRHRIYVSTPRVDDLEDLECRV